MAQEKDVDQVSGIETTGHEWDGIKELNNPLPKWWLWTFYATIVWAAIYVVLYPAIPMVTQATGGLLGYSSRQNVMQDIEAHRIRHADRTEAIAALDIEEVAEDAELMQFALAGGAAVFRAHCSQCHGAGAAGGVGYPNLNDDDWLWGGTREEIYATIAHGIRWEADWDTRISEMPAFGADGLLSREEIDQVVEFVWSLSNDEGWDYDLTVPGAEVFADNCASCHGDDARGNVWLGAPNLMNGLWLYGGDRDAIRHSVHYSRAGVMPAWLGRLSEADVRKVALYVHNLGGGLPADAYDDP